MNNWVIAILPLVGVILGASLQFWLSRAGEREKHVNALQSQAYADYLRSVAAAAHLRSDEDLRDALRDAADAKARIAVYGSASVIGALARFEEAGAVLSDKHASDAFVSLVSIMRPSGSTVPEGDLKAVLVGIAQQNNAPVGASRRR